MALNELAEAGANITDIDTESEAQMEHTFAKGLEMEKAKYEELWKKTWAPIEENVAVLRELYATETDEQALPLALLHTVAAPHEAVPTSP